jgi:hypothetical protein
VKSQLGVVIDEDFHWLWGGEERQRKMSNDDKGGIGGEGGGSHVLTEFATDRTDLFVQSG